MKLNALKRNNDFIRAYKRGKSLVSPLLVTYVVKNRENKTRVGITSSKKIGNAVTRNRARRVIRAALANVLPQKSVGGVDIVFVARGTTAHKKSYQLEPVIKQHLTNAGILKNDK
ncbi:MAG: ribonuclease P protein component [Oscillospiraceae bacterium]